jgi:hypothetical protein
VDPDKEKNMKKKVTVFLSALLFALYTSADAQLQSKMVKIGELVFRSRADLGPAREVFRRELHNLGYVEGKNITFETRSAGGKLDQFPVLADELVRLKVDVLVATSINEALAFKNATRTIPIVLLWGAILFWMDWLTAWRGLEGTSQASRILQSRRPENDWSCSKKPCLKSSVSRSYTIQTIGETYSRWRSFGRWRARWG